MTGCPLAAYEALVCDLDGVVFRGGDPVPGAGETLRGYLASGGRVAYATNNSSRGVEETTRNIAQRDAPVQGQVVVTSAMAGAAAMAREVDAGARVLALGGPGVAEALTREGLEPVAAPDAPGGEIGAGVLQGLGPTLTVDDFSEAARWLQSGCTWVATNGDLTLPVEWGEAPGNGAYVRLLAQTSRRDPAVVGKPAADLYDLCLDRLGVTADRVLAIGDRLETDIDGAHAAGLTSVLVLSGVSRPADVLRLPAERRPHLIADSLAALAEVLPEVQPLDDGARCGDAVVRRGGPDAVEVEGGDSPAALTRAALAVLDACEDVPRGRDALRDKLIDALERDAR